MTTTRLSLVVLCLSACASLPHASGADVVRAQRQWPAVDLAELEAARSTYALRCSGCHMLYLPTERTPRQWTDQVPLMSKRAKLTQAEREQIERFVQVMSQHVEP
jgi:hypothetical protein